MELVILVVNSLLYVDICPKGKNIRMTLMFSHSNHKLTKLRQATAPLTISEQVHCLPGKELVFAFGTFHQLALGWT